MGPKTFTLWTLHPVGPADSHPIKSTIYVTFTLWTLAPQILTP